MITSKNRITRRTVLRGVGGIAVALPFLDAMLLPRQSHAASSIPLRLVVFYSPGGTLLDQWRPTGTETNFTLSSMMAPLNPYKDRVILVDGLDLSVAINKGVGHPHSRGMARRDPQHFWWNRDDLRGPDVLHGPPCRDHLSRLV